MITAESVKAKIRGLISKANATTGKNDTDLSSGVNSLIEGYGTGDIEAYDGSVTVDDGATVVFDEDYAEGKADGVAEGITEGIEQGKKAEYDEFWDSYQEHGNRKSYAFAFGGYGWTAENFKPKYDIRPTVSVRYMFSTINRMKGIDIEQTFKDLGITLDTSGVTSVDGFDYFVQYASPSVLPVISTISIPLLRYCFRDAANLITIRKLILKEDGSQKFISVFNNSRELINLEIEGTIGQNGFDVQDCTKLSKASINSIINHLSITTSGLTVTLSEDAVNTAFETSEGLADGSTSAEWLALVETKSNWTVSLV